MICNAVQNNQTGRTEAFRGNPFCVATLSGLFIGDEMKTCSKCKQTKRLSEFQKNRAQKDGFSCWCKTCNKVYNQSEVGKSNRKHYGQSEKGKTRDKRYRQSEKGKVADRKGKEKYRKTAKGRLSQKRLKARYPNKIKARNAINSAIRIGKMISPKLLLCHYCPKPAQQYHHWHGYEPEHWLNVIPVCTDCHQKCKKKIA